jgi:hypothetical protein
MSRVRVEVGSLKADLMQFVLDPLCPTGEAVYGVPDSEVRFGTMTFP